jgi:hypothetical protein
VIGRGHYHCKHEPWWYVVRKGSTASWVGDHSQTTLWQIDKNLKSETGHGTQKSVECMRRETAPLLLFNVKSSMRGFGNRGAAGSYLKQNYEMLAEQARGLLSGEVSRPDEHETRRHTIYLLATGR